MSHQKFLVLGAGYTGRELVKQGEARGFEMISTHRNQDLRFRLEDSSTWASLPPSVVGTFWTFPALPLEQVKKFLDERSESLGRIVVVGSTGSFPATDEPVTESTVADKNIDRVPGEEEIRRRGHVIVRATGIYGPQRNPLRWVREGRIGPSRKAVHFIHIEDLAQILWAAMLQGIWGAQYLASDGRTYYWDDLIDDWTKRFHIQIPADAKPSKRPSRRIDPSKTLRILDIDLRFPSLHQAIETLGLEG